MSIQLIQKYHAEVDKIIRYGGSRKETSIRKPFHDLLEHYARQKNLELIGELEYRTRTGHTVYPDGTLKDALRQDWGYWESKDEADDLDAEIAKKFARGYPQNNILFEDSQTAVLIQGEEIARVSFLDAPALDRLLTRFVSYESSEVREFREAIENFTRDVPALAEDLRRLIAEQYEANPAFQKAAKEFLELCQEAINPGMETADIREMIVQHVLTEEIFITIFAESQFHRENVIAHELHGVVNTFYKGPTRHHIDGRIAGYTNVIRARAAQIYNHQEKQKFLKVLYENFYKAYNPKAADRLGIVYTPNEIVRFMIEAADTLCHKHFGRTLGDKGVEILDPATGTGTFITELIEYLPPHQLEYKYKNELHCNEVAILPYYIANLNIEYTYKQKMGAYAPFENSVFVDTLDNMGFQTQYMRQLGMFGLTDENLERIERQNKRKISVVIGNPPYNANQRNENENNKNREYEHIDKRIKDTYIKASTAQKTKGYDMYTRFLRWASDRLDKNGIIAFVSNNSFIEARTLDGLRKVVGDEFNEIYVVDMKGDAYSSGEQRQREGGNVFNNAIRVGVAVYFLVRKEGLEGCRIHYNAIQDFAKADEKLAYLRNNRLADLPFRSIHPDKQHNWINLAENDWEDFLPVASKDAKFGKDGATEAIFKLFSLGVVTARDEWVYDEQSVSLRTKVEFFIEAHNKNVQQFFGQVTRDEVENVVEQSIKWTRATKNDLSKGRKYQFRQDAIINALYRPFVKKHLYFDAKLNEMQYQLPDIFPDQNKTNLVISFNFGTPQFACLASSNVFDYALLKFGNGSTQCLPLYRYDSQGNRHDNITDYALTQFQNHYSPQPPAGSEPAGGLPSPHPPITKLAIFHYVYAVLHHPAYRQKYELNLKREFPRIPFYDNFWLWAEWGRQLMELHLNYETVEPYPLGRAERTEPTRQPTKAKLKADKTAHLIELDTDTTLAGIPPIAWEYKLGNRSALEWVLDRYKESTPKDPTIRQKFNTYRFRDYKEQVIDLLARVTTVSVQTMALIAQMPPEIV